MRQLAERVVRAEEEFLREISDTGRSVVTALREESAKTRLLLYLGFKALLERLDQQTEILEEMLAVLREPERTKAREKQNDGIRAYSNGVQTHNPRWFDDAIRDFSTAIRIDRYDFISYWYLGLIHTFELMDDVPAESAFREAAHYAWPGNPTASACALVSLAFVLHANGRTQEAEEAAAQAVTRDANLAIGYYHLAIYCTVNGRFDAALENLRRAILLDSELFNAATVDPILQDCPGIDELLDELSEEARREVVERYLRVFEHSIAEAEKAIRSWDPESLPRIEEERLQARRIAEEIRIADYVALVRTNIRQKASQASEMLRTFVVERLDEALRRRQKTANRDVGLIILGGGLAAVVVGAILGAIMGGAALYIGIRIVDDWYTESQCAGLGCYYEETVVHAPIGPIFGCAIAATIGLLLLVVGVISVLSARGKAKAQPDCEALTKELARWRWQTYRAPLTGELERFDLKARDLGLDEGDTSTLEED